MAYNPYTAPTLTSYNSSPPSDDGDTADSNIAKWQTHLDKIGTPLNNYLDDLDSAITTAFGLIPFAVVSVKTDNYTILSTDQNALLSFEGTAAKTFTLPNLSNANNAGLSYIIINNSEEAALTIDAGSGITINADQTLVLQHSGNWAWVVSNTTGWRTLAKSLSNPFEIKFVTSDQAHSTPLTTDYEAITALSSFTIRSGRHYELMYSLLVDFPVGEIKLQLDTTSITAGTNTGFFMAHDEVGNVYHDEGTGGSVSGLDDATANNEMVVYCKGKFTAGATGTTKLSFGVTVADSEPVTIKAGSYMYLREVG